MINNWFKKSEALPHTGSTVIVVTDADRTYDAYFEKFLGNEIWETSSNFDDTEKILFWRYRQTVGDAPKKYPEPIIYNSKLNK
jgi:hypothetical protein